MSDPDEGERLCLDGRPVLVTGSTGFIGSRLAARLAASGVTVLATHRSPPPVELDVEWVPCDLGDFAGVQALVSERKPAVVMHLASHVAGARAVKLVRPTFVDNLASTVNLLTASAESGVEKVILAGSLEEPEGEAGTAVPSSPYAAAKWAAGGYGRMFHALYGLDVTVARIFMVYGPGQRDVKKLVPYVIRKLLKGEAPRLSSGTRPVDWIYVDDVVEGLIRIAEREGTGGSRIDLGSGEAVTVKDLVLELARLVPGAPAPSFGATPDRPMEQVRVADLEGTRRLLGWEPNTDLTTGLEAAIEWYGARLHDD